MYKVQREAVARTVYVGRMCGWDVWVGCVGRGVCVNL